MHMHTHQLAIKPITQTPVNVYHAYRIDHRRLVDDDDARADEARLCQLERRPRGRQSIRHGIDRKRAMQRVATWQVRRGDTSRRAVHDTLLANVGADRRAAHEFAIKRRFA